MNWPSLDHSAEATPPFCGSSDHFCVSKSKIMSRSSSSLSVIRYRPFGGPPGAPKPKRSGNNCDLAAVEVENADLVSATAHLFYRRGIEHHLVPIVAWS